MRSIFLLVVFFIIPFLSIGVEAAITQAGCSNNTCIQFKNGRPCYYDLTPRFTHTTACAHPRLANLLDQHIMSPPPNASTLAYYNLDDYSFLGGANLLLSEHAEALAAENIAICFSGGVSTREHFVSTCRLAHADDDHIGRGVAAECGRLHKSGIGVIQEGCSTPPPSTWGHYLRSHCLAAFGF